MCIYIHIYMPGRGGRGPGHHAGGAVTDLLVLCVFIYYCLIFGQVMLFVSVFISRELIIRVFSYHNILDYVVSYYKCIVC